MDHVPSFIQRQTRAALTAGFTAEVLLETPSGPLMAFTKKSLGKPPVYISSGCHGDEPAGPLAIAELLEEGFFSDDFSWRLCPVINPDGLAAGTRENASGCDLNRDYFQKTSPETTAHTAWLTTQGTPDIFLSLHEDWESSGIYLYEINCLHGVSYAHAILQSAAPWFPVEPETIIDDHEVREPGWIYHKNKPDKPDDWPEAIYMSHHGCPLSYTFETPSSAKLSKRIACHKAMVKAALTALQD